MKHKIFVVLILLMLLVVLIGCGGKNGDGDASLKDFTATGSVQQDGATITTYIGQASSQKAYADFTQWARSKGWSEQSTTPAGKLFQKGNESMMIFAIGVANQVTVTVTVMPTVASGPGTPSEPPGQQPAEPSTGTVEVLADLQIGDRVVDTSWEWEHKQGANYSDVNWKGDPVEAGEVKPVVWIVVAKDHYDGMPSHVTLMSEQLIGLHAFDDSTDRGSRTGSRGTAHWGDSGTTNAEHGLRPFLNSLPKDEGYSYAGEGFYSAFSNAFKADVLLTTVPNMTKFDSEGNWSADNPWREYTTQDYVFVLSGTEAIKEPSSNDPVIGKLLPYFDPNHSSYPQDGLAIWQFESGLQNVDLGQEQHMWWGRSPDYWGLESVGMPPTGSSTAGFSEGGVRPVVNLAANVKVSETPNAEGVYEIKR